MKKLQSKYKLYDIRQYPYKYVGKRNIYYDEIGNTFILHNNRYIPANSLVEGKGHVFITNYSNDYSRKRVKR